MGRKILVVDDEPHIVKMLEIRLIRNGYEVVTAGSGQEGLDKVKSEKPDLILLDVMMPPPNGFEVCKILRGDPQWKSLPIILLTAKSTEKDQTLGIESGADAYITKPYTPEELLSQIQDLLKKR